MADIRINSLPSTATSFNTDDYIAIDGASAGTRKMLAANPPFTDVTLGASGPSVKSTLSARAPRQGLVFDGSAGASATLGSAIGSGNTTYHVNFLCPSSVGIAGIIAVGDFSIQDSLVIQLDSSDRLALVLYSGGTLYSSYYIPSFTATYGGKRVTVSFTRNGTTISGFVNGISVSLTANNSGTPPAWNTSITSTSVFLGKLQAAAYYLNGIIYNALIYNRALSAAEVVALYEAGAPSGADYNNASNTSLITGDNSTFASDTGYWTKGGSVTIGSGNATFSADAAFLRRDILTGGKRFRLTVVITANTAATGLVIYNGGTALATYNTTGTKVLEISASTAASPANSLYLYQAGAGGVTVDTVTLDPLGLLLAPDAAQAGGGLVWYDTSGNAANITLPASGVSWNVPTSGYVTSGSSLNLAAGGSNQNITLTPSGTGVTVFNRAASAGNAFQWTNGTVSGSIYLQSSGTPAGAALGTTSNHSLYFFTNSSAAQAVLATTGNFLLGTTVDSGYKLVVNGTTYLTGFGGSTALTINRDVSNSFGIYQSGGITYLDAFVSQLRLATGSVTALTLDSSQNATFAGTVTANGPLTLSSSTQGNANFYAISTSANANFGALYEADARTQSANARWNWGTGSTDGGAAADSFRIRARVTGVNALVISAATGDATFAGKITTSAPTGGAGAWELGVYTATAPTATGYVTIEIGGTQYKLLAATA